MHVLLAHAHLPGIERHVAPRGAATLIWLARCSFVSQTPKNDILVPPVNARHRKRTALHSRLRDRAHNTCVSLDTRKNKYRHRTMVEPQVLRGLLAASQLATIIVLLCWIFGNLGGVSLHPSGALLGNDTNRLFNWHPLLMVLAWVVFSAEALLAYRSPLVQQLSRCVCAWASAPAWPVLVECAMHICGASRDMMFQCIIRAGSSRRHCTPPSTPRQLRRRLLAW